MAIDPIEPVDALLAGRALASADRSALAAALAGLHAAGCAAWPALDVSPVALAAALAVRAAPLDPAALAGLHAADLYVAVACARGEAAAIAGVEDGCFGEVEHAARRTGASPAQAADVRGELRRLLFVAEGARPAAIARYSGRGELRAYVRIMATRALVRVVQRGRREVSLEDAMVELLSPATDPALAHLREVYRDEVGAALRAACAALEPEPRALLRYSLVEGWSIDRLGALLGVHRSSAARRVAAARDRLGALMRAALAARLGIDPTEVDSIVRLVQSRVEISLARVLTAEAS